MKRLVLWLGIFLAAAPQAFALVNAGFETGDLTSWSYTNMFGDTGDNAGVVGTDQIKGIDGNVYTIDPVEGSHMTRLTCDAWLTHEGELDGSNTLSFWYRIINTDDLDNNMTPFDNDDTLVIGLHCKDSAGKKSLWSFDEILTGKVDSGWKYFEARPDNDGHVYNLSSFDIYLCNSFYSVYIDDFKANDSGTPAPVPEPASLSLVSMGLFGFVGIKKLRKYRKA